MEYLIIGNKGQLGKEFEAWMDSNTIPFLGVDIDQLDVSNQDQVINLVQSVNPEIILNCSAYNQVDLAEKNVTDAFNANAIGVQNIIEAAELTKSFVVHYSSDYVFDGKKNDLYIESDTPNPLNNYGKSKLKGEEILQSGYDDYLLFRLSWVFGPGQQNFIYKLSKWLKSSAELNIANDEISVPTYTKTIVEVTMKSLGQGLKGLYHLTNTGYTSRFGWAEFIINEMNINNKLNPVSKDIFNLPAIRPDFSAMSNELLSETLNISIPTWEEAVKEYMANYLVKT